MEDPSSPDGGEGAPPGARPWLLRLDDGSVIVPTPRDRGLPNADPVRLTFAEARRHNLVAVTEDVQRLRRLVAKGSELLPPPVVATAYAPAEDKHAAKRPRLDNGASHGPAGVDWTKTAADIVEKVCKYLGSQASWFQDQVDQKLVPDYYQHVKWPGMWTGKVREKLSHGLYSTPQEFYDDFSLIWSNCRTYNARDTPVRIAGDKADKKFTELWLASGLQQDRGRRATAGVAATKYEPENFEAPPKPKTSKSLPKQGTKRPQQPNGIGRTVSHEVTSAAKGTQPQGLSEARRLEIFDLLQNVMPNLEDDQQADLLQLMPETALKPDEDGDMELDVTVLDDASLVKIETFLRALAGGTAGGGGAAANNVRSPTSHNPSVRIDANSEEDDDDDDSSDS